MEGTEKVVDLWRKHQLTLEVFGLDVSLQGARVREGVRPISLSF